MTFDMIKKFCSRGQTVDFKDSDYDSELDENDEE